jgi:hypothetical protein
MKLFDVANQLLCNIRCDTQRPAREQVAEAILELTFLALGQQIA